MNEQNQKPSTADKKNYAGGWIRFLAYIIDAILLGLVMGVINTLQLSYQTSQFLSVLISLGYLVVMIAQKQQTVGMMALKLKVVSEKKDINWWSVALMREVLGRLICGVTLGIGYLIIFWHKKKQGLHDLVANTTVIKEED